MGEQYNQYWSQYAAWQQWYAAQAQAAQTTPPAPPTTAAKTEQQQQETKPCQTKQKSIFDGSLKESVQNKCVVDYSALNQEYLEKSEELYAAVEESRWSIL